MPELDEEVARHRFPDPSSQDGFVLGPIRLDSGPSTGPLAGLRFAVKDLFDVAGTRTGAGNPQRLADVPVATAHAPCVEALVAAGAELVGKTVSDELAFSLSGTNVHYGTPRNPAAPGRVPGGSSSGSVSVVADGLVDFSLGTDTGGSTRVPASYCGVYGMRVTHGRVPQAGVFLLAPSFCSVGIFAREASMLGAVWSVLAEAFPSAGGKNSRRPGRLLMVPELFALADQGAKPALVSAAEGFAARTNLPLVVCDQGALGEPGELLEAFRAIQLFEAWQLHGAWVAEHHDALGWGIAARFDSGAGVDENDLVFPKLRRTQLQHDLAALLGGDGYLLQPAASGPAPEIDLDGAAKDDLRLRTMMLTAPAGLAGSPVVSMPLAKYSGLPVGLAIVGLSGDDETVIDLSLQGSVTP